MAPLASAIVLVVATLLGGCISHPVKFDKASYVLPATIGGIMTNTSVNAVITPETLAEKKTISAWMTGIAHKWDAEPGSMLKDVVEIEFPQTFSRYEIVPAYSEPATGDRRATLVLSVPNYNFADFHATLTLHAVMYSAGKNKLFEKSYTASGVRQGAKMFWGGAFGMKSAIRQSSLDAFKQAFAQLRPDIGKAFEVPN